MKCKGCGKELIGRERHFCKNCWSKGKDKGKKVLGIATGVITLYVLTIVNKERIADFLGNNSVEL